MIVLVIDVGGTHVKLHVSDEGETRRFRSGPQLTPETLVRGVREHVNGWTYDVVSFGYPGTVHENAPAAEPGNLSPGWVGFDFAAALERPMRMVNDAAMQALGGYDGGRMLFLGLGTGLGSALVSEHVIMPLELGMLPYSDTETLFDRLGRAGLKRNGQSRWLHDVHVVIPALRAAFAADYILLGGGNAKHVTPLPEGVRRGGNEDAFTGGLRLWEEMVEPHDRRPPAAWRVLK